MHTRFIERFAQAYTTPETQKRILAMVLASNVVLSILGAIFLAFALGTYSAHISLPLVFLALLFMIEMIVGAKASVAGLLRAWHGLPTKLEQGMKAWLALPFSERAKRIAFLRWRTGWMSVGIVILIPLAVLLHWIYPSLLVRGQDGPLILVAALLLFAGLVGHTIGVAFITNPFLKRVFIIERAFAKPTEKLKDYFLLNCVLSAIFIVVAVLSLATAR